MIEKLTAPQTIQTPYGPMDATHAAWGMTYQIWNGSVQSYKVLGRLDADGKFQPYPGTEEYATIEGADLEALRAPNAQGKPADVFRNTDVIAKHKEIRGRK